MPPTIKQYTLSSEHLPPEGKCLGFTAFGLECFILKKGGAYFAYRNYCPHMGIPLNWQENEFLDVDDCLIQCASHGALFLIETGQCVSGPCNGASLQRLNFEKLGRELIVEIPITPTGSFSSS